MVDNLKDLQATLTYLNYRGMIAIKEMHIPSNKQDGSSSIGSKKSIGNQDFIE